MESLYLPPSLRYFEPMRVVDGEGMDHAAFEYDLASALRPGLVVDVGAGSALSFSVVCQSMRDHDVDGIGYAIDGWDDDTQKSDRDETTWVSINNFLRTHFRGIAYLLRGSVESALRHFAAGSITLLRIDAARAGVPLAKLLDAWMPLLAPGGVLLGAGVGDPARSDVREVWEGRFGAIGVVFPKGRGLGVIRTAPVSPAASEPELLRLLACPDGAERAELVRYYAHVSRHHALRLRVRDRGDGLYRKNASA